MKKVKLTKDTIPLALIVVLSAILNFVNLGIEGTANSYYAAAVKSMTVNFKNFFFVAFDSAGFMSIDKPPLGFWLQAISAKIFGFSGWSIILPQALAGVISVIVIYKIVKRSFGHVAGLLSALFLAVTPVFVAASRNNTIDNTLVLALLFACWALSIAAEKGKLKYLIISLALVGVGFNIKMLQAYMVVPALYITYLLSSATSIKKRIVHLLVGTLVLVAVSFSWAIVVDLVPASSRPYVDSSTNNTVMELIFGHNAADRLSLSSGNGNGGGGPQGNKQTPPGFGNNSNSNSSTNNNQSTTNSNTSTNSTQNQNSQSFPNGGPSDNTSNNNTNNNTNNQGFPNGGPNGNNSNNTTNNTSSNTNTNSNNQGFPGGNQGMPGNPPSGDGRIDGGHMGNGGPMGNGGGPGGNSGNGNLQGSFGGQIKSSITRLFSKNILSDQIVWFIPLAVLGFIAAAIKEKLRFRLDNKRQQALVLWFMWFFPGFILFSYTTGTFHPYYLTMLAAPVAALAAIGITSMWEMYKEDGWKSWFLPVSLLVNGAMQLLMLYYFISSSNIIKVLMALLIILCFGSSIALAVLKLIKKKSIDSESDIDNAKANKTKVLLKDLVVLALAGLLVTPFVGSAAVLTTKLNNSFPSAGLELLSTSSQEKMLSMTGLTTTNKTDSGNNQNSKLINFLQKNKTSNQKYLLVVSNSNSASEIIIQTGEAVMSLGGFMGNDKAITLDEFKALVKKGEIRYVMTGGQGGQGGQGSGNSISEIMSWVQENGTLVSASVYGGVDMTSSTTEKNSTNSETTVSSADSTNNQNTVTNTSNVNSEKTVTPNNTANAQNSTESTNSRDSQRGSFAGMGGGNSGQLYDLKAYTDSASTK